MNIPQNKLESLVYLLPDCSGILSAVYKNLFSRTFEYAALRCNMKRTAARQNRIGIGGIIFSITFNL